MGFSSNRIAVRVATIAAFVLFAAACGCATGCQGSQDGGRAVAATFGDHVIYEDEVSDYTQQFRERQGLSDDSDWASYLSLSGMDGKTWREDVIRKKADRLLVEDKAAELGISADMQAVDDRIDEMRKASGAEDDAQWSANLQESGQTEETLRDSLEYSSVQQQVIEAEADLSADVREEMCTDYLKTNLADQVVRHYFAMEYPEGEKERAEDALTELKALSEDELAARFSDEAVASGDAVDLGWDFVYAEAAIDPDTDLRNAKLAAGTLYDKVLAGSDALRLVYCAERESFGGEISYANIESESLKSLIADLTLSSQWAARVSQYLSELESEANVQVVPMPEGLPYDVIDRQAGDGSDDDSASSDERGSGSSDETTSSGSA